MILVIADYLTLEDLQAAHRPNIDRLLSQGAIGLVSPSALGFKTPDSVYASLGAGAQVRGSWAADEGYSVSEKVESEEGTAADVYSRRTGERPPEAGVVNLGIGPLREANESNGQVEKIGEFGKALREAGRKVAVFGNSDTEERLSRPAAALACDETGRIPFGDVSSALLHKQQMSATGWVTNVDRLADSVETASRDAALVVADFGDTARLHLSRMDLSERAYVRYKNETLDRLDAFVGRMVRFAESRGVTLVFASFVPPYEIGRSWTDLTPVVVYGRGSKLLSSATTRRSGLVTGVDVAPSILGILGVRVPDTMGGRPIIYKNSPDPLTYLDRLDRSSATAVTLKWPWLVVLVVPAGLLLTLAACAAVFQWRLRRNAKRFLRLGLVMAYSCLPGLLLGGLGGPSIAGQAAVVAVGTLGVAALGYLIARILRRFVPRNSLALSALPMVGMLMVTAALVLIDGLTGARLNASSVIGYQAVAGFRFYGIGNEFMGVLIGALTVSMTWLAVNSGGEEPGAVLRAVIFIVFLFAVFVLGWPAFGANAGGTIAATIAFGLTYRAVSKGVFRAREIGFLLLAGLGLLLIFSIGDLVLNGTASSHMGFAAGSAARGGWLELLWIVLRKIGMNLSLIGTRQARTTLICFAPFLALWLFRVRPVMMGLSKQYPRLRQGMPAIVAGIAAAFVFNDSGVVSACMIFGALACTVMYTLLQEEPCGVAHNGS